MPRDAGVFGTTRHNADYCSMVESEEQMDEASRALKRRVEKVVGRERLRTRIGRIPKLPQKVEPEKAVAARLRKRGDTQEASDEPKKWIQKAIKKPGALSRQLGIPEKKDIPMKKLRAAAKKPGKLGRRARLAMTLKKLHK